MGVDCVTGATIRAALAAATAELDFSATPRLDAELLMAAALGVTHEYLLIGQYPDLSLYDAPPPAAFAPLLARRLAHEPIAYITGTRAFWTIELAVGPGVLVPRADSETLIEAAVAHFAGRAPATILDLGAGPGTLLLAALDQWPEARGLGVDASPDALAYAERNTRDLGLAARARFVQGDWAEGLAGKFDLILSNPPYVGADEPLPAEVREHEPGVALFAGADGLAAYRIIVPQLPALLAPGGVAIVEIGSTQATAVTALLEAQGFAVALRHDLGGNPRALSAS